MDLATQYAEKALAILEAHKLPASSWTDTDEYRGEVRGSGCGSTSGTISMLQHSRKQ
jgi:hypothetical protein